MPISKEQKKEIVKKVKDAVSGAKSVVFVNFHGLPVSDESLLRKELRKNEVSFLVAKKTLAKIALNDIKPEGEMPALDGEIAFAFGTDLLAPAREVYNFQKKLEGKLAIVGGIFDGVYKNMEEMVSIANIPSQKVLYGQFVQLINSPIQGFVLALNALAEKKAQ